MLASFPVASIFAAPDSGKNITEYGNLEQEWKDKLRTLHLQGLFYDGVRLNPTDLNNRDDLARAHYFLEK